jgi:uncharacterized protein YkwD
MRDTEEGKAASLREFRKVMLEEVNFARTRPDDYAEKRLKTSKEEGVDNGAYAYLKRADPVGELRLSKILNSISMDYAAFLAKKNKFSHTANGTPFTRAKKAGYRYMAMGENIACGNDPQLNINENPRYAAVEFVKMLIIDKGVKDLGHRHTIMNPLYRSVGFGFGHNPRSYCVNYVVQDFGNP